MAENQMIGVHRDEGHAQFHRREPLKSFLSIRSSASLCFLQELPPLILNCLASPVFTHRCFHYANTGLVAGFMFFFTFFKWEMGLRKLTCLPLAGTYEKLVFGNIINHTRAGQLVCVIEKRR